MQSIRYLVVFLTLTACVQITEDDTYSGPLRPSDGPVVTITVPKEEIRENQFDLEVGFKQKEMGVFTYSVQIIGPTQLAEDYYLARKRVVHPKGNPTVVPFDGVAIFCGTYYEVRVEAFDSHGIGVGSYVFPSHLCTNRSMAACALSNLTSVIDVNGQRHLQFAVTGIKPGNGCTWKVEVKHGSLLPDSEFVSTQSGDVYADQVIDLVQPVTTRGVTWFRVTGFDHTPLRRTFPLQNAFSAP